MLHAGLDLSRRKVDVCLLSGAGEQLDQLAIAPDADSLRRLARAGLSRGPQVMWAGVVDWTPEANVRIA